MLFNEVNVVKYCKKKKKNMKAGLTWRMGDLAALRCCFECGFLVFQSDCVDKREVRQFQFTAWPDHGVPDHPTPLLLFMRRVKAMTPSDSGPIITHCR